jgi:hypothetical protein
VYNTLISSNKGRKMKWYLFDRSDCFESFKTGEEAVHAAHKLIMDDFTGIEIRYMSEAEFAAYCKGDAAHKAFVAANK